MRTEAAAIDISESHDLLKLAEEVNASRQPRLLKRGEQALALLTPIESPSPRPRRRRPRSKPLDQSDPIFSIIGIVQSEGATDVSENKHKYLAEALYAEFHDGSSQEPER